MIMKNKKAFKNLIFLGATLSSLTLCGCSGCIGGSDNAEGTVYHGAEVPDESTSSESVSSESSVTTESIAQTSEVQTETSEAPSTESSTAQTTEENKELKYPISNIINQRATSFGDMGCGGAAALMAMQALGLYGDIDTDAEYADFWNTVPKSYNPNQGWSNNYGIWNPAYCNWVGGYAKADRIQNYSVKEIRKYLEAGSTVIPLVSLGDTGNYTHWFTVYGFYENDGITYFYVADPWGGGLREYTENKLDEKIQEAARRKGRLGFGSETEGVVVSK